jgi:hypothetical protein
MNNINNGCCCSSSNSSYINSYISSIFNTNEQLSLKSNNYLMKTSNSVESLNTSSSSSVTSTSSQSSEQKLAENNNLLTFNVKMASTPKVSNKIIRKDFSSSKLSSTRYCEHCMNENARPKTVQKVVRKDEAKKRRRTIHLGAEQNKIKKIKLSNNKDIKLQPIHNHNNKKLVKKIAVDCDVTSTELLNCNNYLKHLIKKQAHGFCSGVHSNKQAKIKVSNLKKLKHQFKIDINNVSTSTKKMSESDLFNTKVKRRKSSSSSSSNKQKHMINDDLRKHLNHHDMINLNNNYFQSGCLNKFNQFGQFQVWYV